LSQNQNTLGCVLLSPTAFCALHDEILHFHDDEELQCHMSVQN